MSVASSTVASKKSRLSRSSRAKNSTKTQGPIITLRRGNESTAEATPGGSSSPRVRDRPASTEPPPGRGDVLRPRNGYNQQASSSRTGLTVETVRDKGGSGSSSYEEFTVSENDDQWHSPTNITPDKEYPEPHDEDDGSETDYD